MSTPAPSERAQPPSLQLRARDLHDHGALVTKARVQRDALVLRALERYGRQSAAEVAMATHLQPNVARESLARCVRAGTAREVRKGSGRGRASSVRYERVTPLR